MSSSSSAPLFNPNPKHPFTGSCHCGQIRYVVFLRFPSNDDISSISLPPLEDRLEEKGPLPNGFYRCNCTVCHKMGLFHLRPEDPFEDFWLISPVPDSDTLTGDNPGLKGLKALRSYSPNNDDESHFFFCYRCGVRPFSFSGRGKLERVKVQLQEGEKNVLEWLIPSIKSGHGEEILVWKPIDFPPSSSSHQSQTSDPPCQFYLSVNAITINDQSRLNLRKFQDKKMVGYLEVLENTDKIRWGAGEGENEEEGPWKGGIW